MGIFSISPLNPIRFVKDSTFNKSLYATIGFDNALQIIQTREYQDVKPYSQKYTLLDRPVIQILSDYNTITCKVYDMHTGVLFASPVVNTVTTTIVSQTFACYEIGFDWTIEGDFYVVISYVDELSATINYFSEPINIKTIQENTLRFEYTNSANDFSMIFNGSQDKWVGILRIEGDIIDFKPASIDTIYTDEVHNTQVVVSRPFKQFSLSIGGNTSAQRGEIPNYLADKINRILSCNQVKIDGNYYCKSEGAQWEVLRALNNPFCSQKINITDAINNFQLVLDTSNIGELMIPIQKELQYFNNTANLVISGVFKKYTYIEDVLIYNKTGTPYDFTIATSTTGTDGDFTLTETGISDLVKIINVRKAFSIDKIINITGIDSINTDVFVVYKKLNAPTTGTINPYTQLGVGAVCYYEEQNAGDFLIDWDIATGLGQAATAWAGWAIMNGAHGTGDPRNRVILATDGITDQTLRPVHQTGGSWLKQILITDLPVLFFRLFGKHKTGTPAAFPTTFIPLAADDTVAVDGGNYSGFDQYRISKSEDTGVVPASLGKTNSLGGINGDGTGGVGQTLDITPPFLRMIMVKKIQDL